MSALREWAASVGGKAKQAVAVSSLGKWKTATQVRGARLSLHAHRVRWQRCVTGASSPRPRCGAADGVAGSAAGRA